MEPSENVTPAALVRKWVEAFNRADSDALAAFYTEDAVNHQVALSPVVGRSAIRRMFAAEFALAKMTCLIENIFEDGDWAMLEWHDPMGIRGCGFFRVAGGRIVLQRGYWDRLSFSRAQGKLPSALREVHGDSRGDSSGAQDHSGGSRLPEGPAAPTLPAASTASLEVVPYVDALHRVQVIGLWETVFGYDTAHNKPSLAIDRKRAVQDELFFVATRGDLVVGTIMAGYDGHRGWLYAVAVDPAQRLGGVGRALVTHAEQALAKRGCVKINLQIRGGNERVTAFYQSLGYVVEPRVSMGKGIPGNIPGA